MSLVCGVLFTLLGRNISNLGAGRSMSFHTEITDIEGQVLIISDTAEKARDTRAETSDLLRGHLVSHRGIVSGRLVCSIGGM